MAFEWSPLLESLQDTYVMMIQTRRPDGRGGSVYTWEEGEEFEAIVELQNSLEEETALAAGITGVYNVTVEKANQMLVYHSIFKNKATGATYRITSKDENISPRISDTNLRNVRAEDYVLEY